MRKMFGIGFCMFALAFTAKADIQLLSNGGFEAGSLAGWTVTSSGGSLGTWLANTGNFTPLTGNQTVGAASGNWYAVTDQFGPGVNALSQAFTVPVGPIGHIFWSFDMFVNDWGTDFTSATQYLRLGLLAQGANPVSGAFLAFALPAVPVLVSGGVPNPYIHYSINLSGLVTAGQTYQIDFRESDAAFPMNVGVDNVSIVATPEPSSVVLLLGVLVAAGVRIRKHGENR